jgi:hypothetical protein
MREEPVRLGPPKRNRRAREVLPNPSSVEAGLIAWQRSICAFRTSLAERFLTMLAIKCRMCHSTLG